MKKRTVILLSVIGSVLFITIAAFFVYVSDYYRPDDFAKQQFDSHASPIESQSRLHVFYEGDPQQAKTALIFYPGGKVDARSYAPLLHALSKQGVLCVLVTMPFHLAVFDIRAADRALDAFDHIQHRYIGGHSLGGAMAAIYADSNATSFHGLILLGAYSINEPKIESLTIVGTKDQVINRDRLVVMENQKAIEGGNHAYFGHYGEQKGDGAATITRQEQQEITVSMIIDFINDTSTGANEHENSH